MEQGQERLKELYRALGRTEDGRGREELMALIAAEESRYLASEPAHCRRCGALLSDSDRFCGKCGCPAIGPLPEKPASKPAPAAPASKPAPAAPASKPAPEQIAPEKPSPAAPPEENKRRKRHRPGLTAAAVITAALILLLLSAGLYNLSQADGGCRYVSEKLLQAYCAGDYRSMAELASPLVYGEDRAQTESYFREAARRELASAVSGMGSEPELSFSISGYESPGPLLSRSIAESSPEVSGLKLVKALIRVSGPGREETLRAELILVKEEGLWLLYELSCPEY